MAHSNKFSGHQQLSKKNKTNSMDEMGLGKIYHDHSVKLIKKPTKPNEKQESYVYCILAKPIIPDNPKQNFIQIRFQMTGGETVIEAKGYTRKKDDISFFQAIDVCLGTTKITRPITETSTTSTSTTTTTAQPSTTNAKIETINNKITAKIQVLNQLFQLDKSEMESMELQRFYTMYVVRERYVTSNFQITISSLCPLDISYHPHNTHNTIMLRPTDNALPTPMVDFDQSEQSKTIKKIADVWGVSEELVSHILRSDTDGNHHQQQPYMFADWFWGIMEPGPICSTLETLYKLKSQEGSFVVFGNQVSFILVWCVMFLFRDFQASNHFVFVLFH